MAGKNPERKAGKKAGKKAERPGKKSQETVKKAASEKPSETPAEREIEIEIPNPFKKLTPTQMFGLVLVLCVVLVAAFYTLSSSAQPEGTAGQAGLGQAGVGQSELEKMGLGQDTVSPGTQPQEPEVTLYILNDKTCISCTTGSMLVTIRSIFTNLNEVEVDYNSPEGKALAEEAKLVSVPAYIFDSSAKASPSFPIMQPYLFELGDYYVARVLGNKLINREEIPDKLDLFVMPTEENAIAFEYTVKEFIDDYSPSFSLYFVAHEEGDEIVSIMGAEDAAEGIRQACAMKYEPDLFEYLFCRNKDITADWEACAQSLDGMKECSEGEEGITLMRENLQESKPLGIGASPTLIVNNQFIILGNNPYGLIETIYCSANPDKCGQD